MYFIGQLGKESMINAIGLGNTFVNILGYSTVFGLNGALSTFASQSAGAKNYDTCGMYAWRARYFFVFVHVLMFPLYFWSGEIMKACNQDAEVSEIAGRYLMYQYPAIFILGMLDVDRNLLSCLERSYLSMCSQILSPFFHSGFCYMYIIKEGLEERGAGLAMISTNLVIFLI
jgi:MATE family multidrug resistance protein